MLSPGFKKNLQERGIAENKIQVIYNWCEEQPVQQENFDSNLAKDFGISETFNIVFAGTMGVIQEITQKTSEGAGQVSKSIGNLSSLVKAMHKSVAGFKLPETENANSTIVKNTGLRRSPDSRDS